MRRGARKGTVRITARLVHRLAVETTPNQVAELLRAALATPEPPERTEILTPAAPPPVPTFHLEVCIGGSMHGMEKEVSPRYSAFIVPIMEGIKARLEPRDCRNIAATGFPTETYRRAALHTSGPGERVAITWWHLEGLPVDDDVLAQVARAWRSS